MEDPSDTFTITPAWIHAHGNGGIGWTKRQLDVLGVTWPPRKGWLRSLVGRQITAAQQRQFEQLLRGNPPLAHVDRPRKATKAVTGQTSPKRVQASGKMKKRLRRMVAARLGGSMSTAQTQLAIRRQRPDAPDGLSAYALYEWFIRQTPEAVPRTERTRSINVPDEFLKSYEWRKVRMEVIVERGARCECCGARPGDGDTIINVDHIKPRRDFPALRLDKTNLQVLCHVCNHGKGNWDRTDWRPFVPASEPARVPVVRADGFLPVWSRPRLVRKKA